MLRPVLIRASFKVAGAELVILEDLVGSNLPLLFPSLLVMNRTGEACSVSVLGEVRTLFTGQPDPDFDGAVVHNPFVAFAVGQDQTQVVSTLATLFPASYGVTTEITLTNSGPAAEAWVTLVLRGMIESSVTPDPGLTINV